MRSIAAGVATINANNTSQTAAAIAAGKITLEASTGADLSVVGKADILKALGLTTATGSGNATVTAARTTTSASLGSLISDGSTLNVNGKTITFKNGRYAGRGQRCRPAPASPATSSPTATATRLFTWKRARLPIS